MEKLKLVKGNSHIVSSIIEVPEGPKGIVIAVHGFSSSKEGSTYQLLLERLPAAGYGMIAIDLPGHGTEESARELLRVGDAIDSIEAAEKYVTANYPDVKICYFASSFGAWLTGLYISQREHNGRKAFFRSTAVNMPELFIKENPTELEKQYLRDLETKGYFDTDMDLDASVRITKGLFQDFMETDLFRDFNPDRFGQHQIIMAHGEKDQVIDPDAAKRFAELFNIPIIIFPDEGHSLAEHKGTADQVISRAIELFNS